MPISPSSTANSTEAASRPSLRLMGGLDGMRDFAFAWPSAPEDRVQPSQTQMLARAVAGIVAVALDRARDAGEAALLRDELRKILDHPIAEADIDPREAGLGEAEAITDAEGASEAERLSSLMQRQSGR